MPLVGRSAARAGKPLAPWLALGMLVAGVVLTLWPPVGVSAQDDGVHVVEALPGAPEDGRTGLRFDPEVITIQEGDTVRWVNIARTFHTVTESDSIERGKRTYNGGFNENLPGDATVELVFDEPGTFHYFCGPHVSNDMVGTVIVEPSADATAGGGTEDSPGIGPLFVVAGTLGLVVLGRRS